MNTAIYKAMVRQTKPLILPEKKKSKWSNLVRGMAYNNFLKKIKV